APSPAPSYPPTRLSGKQWCVKFPNSQDVNALSEPFKSRMQRFIAVLERNGANVQVNSTLRPAQRAYLMHYSFKIARQDFHPGRVPSMTGVDIIWNHPNAVSAAEEMVKEYAIVFEPALHSSHTEGRAVDMVVRNLPSSITVPTSSGDKIFKIGSAL